MFSLHFDAPACNMQKQLQLFIRITHPVLYPDSSISGMNKIARTGVGAWCCDERSFCCMKKYIPLYIWFHATILKGWLLLLHVIPVTAGAQNVINLYEGTVPNAKQPVTAFPAEETGKGVIRNVVQPSLTVYLPEKEKATGAAVIICPGGSYAVLVFEAEGINTAKEFVKNGIAAFVLKYRLPDDAIMKDQTTGPLQDAQEAMALVRQHAAEWGIDPGRVGMMGFSAGGHLVSTAATHFDRPVLEKNKQVNLRPDFHIVVYPVISMQDSLTHKDSRKNLLGDHPSRALIEAFSNELQVTDNTPPAYITHAGDDKLVDVENSIAYYEQLRHHHVPAEMHLYPKGDHGFVLKQKTADWMALVIDWMRRNEWIPAKQ